MFELVKALEEGAEELRKRTANPISLNAGCELFIAFVTLFPHESDVRHPYYMCPYLLSSHGLSPFWKSFSGLKKELVQAGRAYAESALAYRDKIASLVLEFIKDDSVVRTASCQPCIIHERLKHASYRRY